MMKYTAFLVLILILTAMIAGCNPAGPTEPAETEPVLTSAPVPLIQNGSSEYVIVHQHTKETMLLAMAIQEKVKDLFGVELTMGSGEEVPEGGCEIVIGAGRPVGEQVMEALPKEYDFAVKAAGKQLILCAKNEVSYNYLESYLFREVLVKGEDPNLVLDPENDIVYSASKLAEMNFVDYKMAAGEKFTMTEIFDRGEHKDGSTSLLYRIYVPFNYSPEKTYPIYVNLHGAGHRGISNESQLFSFMLPLLKNPDLGMDEMILIFPQCPSEQKWVDTNWGKGNYSVDAVPESNELAALVSLIGEVQKKYSVDEKRIYVCGLSMGGFGTWDLLMRHPDIFCAGIPMCGGADPSKAEVLADIPVWTVHGAKDPTVPVSGTREMADAMKAIGAEHFRYTELPDHEHDVWNYTYGNVEMFTWLFSQKKP